MYFSVALFDLIKYLKTFIWIFSFFPKFTCVVNDEHSWPKKGKFIEKISIFYIVNKLSLLTSYAPIFICISL